MGKKLLLLLISVLFSLSLYSYEVTMGVSFAIPPFVISESNRGVEIEIIMEVFRAIDVDVNIYYLPLARTFFEFEKGSIDGIINVRDDTVDNAYLTDRVITFNNTVISLKKNGHPEKFSIDYLLDKSIVAFQRAPDLLKQGLERIAVENDEYSETSTQLTQILRLFMERSAEFIILEENIFHYYREEARETIGNAVDQEVTIHRVFKPIDYKFAFNSEYIRDDFNRGLDIIRSNGVYDRIFQKYSVSKIDLE